MKAEFGRASSVTHVELQGPKIGALVTVRVDRRVTQHTMDAAELMSAVLLFCRKTRIPLSTRSHKRLSLVLDCLALTTSINLRPATPRIDGGAVVYVHAGPDLALMHTA